ncbi:MAG: protein kinase [Lentisphaeraceae bacterium]|nr:protein kinase [Lentisphaeraceae bacterium]
MEEQVLENILKVRCHECDHRIVVEDPKPLTKTECPECEASFYIPKQIENFLLESPISDDGIIAQYHGTDLRLNRRVVFKIINSEFIDADKVYNVGVGSFTHENMASTFGTETIDGDLILLTEYIDGDNLEGYLEKGMVLEMDSILSITKDLVYLLSQAAKEDVHHGHLSLNSIWVTAEGDIKVADFVIRQKVRENCPKDISAKVLEAKYFRSLEDIKVNQETDLYSLGICLYKLTTGNFPEGQCQAPKTINESVPSNLNDAIIALVSGSVSSFDEVSALLEDQVKSDETPVTAVKESKPKVKSVKLNSEKSESKPTRSSANNRLNQQLAKSLKTQLLMMRILLIFAIAVIVIFASTRYMPNSGLGKKSEIILNKTLDKAFAGDKEATDELDVNEILNTQ